MRCFRFTWYLPCPWNQPFLQGILVLHWHLCFSAKQEVRPSAESENREPCVGGSSRGEVPFISQMSVVCLKGNSYMCHIYAIIFVKNTHTLYSHHSTFSSSKRRKEVDAISISKLLVPLPGIPAFLLQDSFTLPDLAPSSPPL